MEQGKRRVDGYIYVADEGTATDRNLKTWLDIAVGHVSTLPAEERTAAKVKSVKSSRRQG